ncbi:pilus assembly FimT family protein [Desulfovibrio sp. TomC]|uniref:pilus assembly FimT family protein n=1 Tax=Desulfovibrio sp. TomC TaxID=1562888 RepID=UPI0005751256|nr:GspH/FimT family pseudopilin [Desulfovibrio sp. TomC]KHK01159.1 hypothetical protein NY78_3352 [Desulfovibrio sp. TomC]
MYARHQAGFTLVELTIVLVVLGLSAGLVLPALSGLLAREGEKSTARILTGVLRRARSEAILTGEPWRVDIDWDKGECRLGPNTPKDSPDRATSPRERAAANNRKKTASTATPSAAAGIDAAMTPKKTATLPAVKLQEQLRPRLAMISGKTVDQPAVVSIVVRPEGLCQPAFLRLPGSGGTDAAVTISAVGCRVEMITAGLDTAQMRFQKAQGLADPPWAYDAAKTGR